MTWRELGLTPLWIFFRWLFCRWDKTWNFEKMNNWSYSFILPGNELHNNYMGHSWKMINAWPQILIQGKYTFSQVPGDFYIDKYLKTVLSFSLAHLSCCYVANMWPHICWIFVTSIVCVLCFLCSSLRLKKCRATCIFIKKWAMPKPSNRKHNVQQIFCNKLL